MNMFLFGILILSIYFVNPSTIEAIENDKCIHCPEYIGLPAEYKLIRLWNKIAQSAYDPPYPPMFWPRLKLLGLFDESMNTTFDRFSDELPNKRVRLVHTYGSVARVSYISHISNENKYTGIYKTGTKNALMRLSLAVDPLLPFAGFSPGFAIKFFLSKQYSANLIGMYEILGQGQNYNFFASQLKTKIKAPIILTATHLLQKSFDRGAKPSNILASDTPSLYDDKGNLIPNPKYPAMIYLVPSEEMCKKDFKKFIHDFRKDLAKIETGTKIYDVYATEEECNCGKSPCKDILRSKDRCKAELIGTIQTESEFVASEYGDKQLFFQHSRAEKDKRQTCVYAEELDAQGRDSTVISMNPRADCQRGTECEDKGDNQLILKRSGCPYDELLKTTKSIQKLPEGHPVLRSID